MVRLKAQGRRAQSSNDRAVPHDEGLPRGGPARGGARYQAGKWLRGRDARGERKRGAASYPGHGVLRREKSISLEKTAKIPENLRF